MRIVYVNPALAAGCTGPDLIERWWSTTATMEAVAAASKHDVHVLWRVTVPHPPLSQHQVTHHFHVDTSRFGWSSALRARRLKPDVLHLNGFVMPWRSLICRLLTRRARCLVQHHGESPSAGWRGRAAQRLLGRVVHAATFTGADHGMAQPWRDAGVVPHRLAVHDVIETVVTFPPCDDPPVEATPPDLDGTNGPRVLWVGRLIADKDVMTAIAVLARLRATGFAEAELWLLGSDDSAAIDAVRRAAAALGVGGGLHVVGLRPRAHMPFWYRFADVSLSTSRREGSGYAVLEALACHTRVAVTDLPSHRSIVTTPNLRFPIGDVDAACAAIRAALEQPPEVSRGAARELLNVYESLVDLAARNA